MKSLSAIVVSFFLCAGLTAQGIEFFHGSWAEALEKAAKEERLIFVDAFASWCGPCKRMARETFPDETVGEFFNANFVSLKIDMEKPENEEFASKYPVSSYPTLLFIDEKGKIVMKEVGAKDPEGLIGVAKKALGKIDRSVQFEQKYAEGDRDPQMLYNYVRALNMAGKPSLKITNEYLNTQKDLTTEFNLRFILEGAVEADSRVFDLLVKYKAKIAALAGEETVKKRIETACKNTVKKSVEFKNETLLAEAKSKMKQGSPERAELFGYESDMHYCKACKDVKGYLSALEGYRKKEAKTAAQQHDVVVSLLRAFPAEEKALAQAEKWAKQAAEEGQKPEYYMTLADIYKRRGSNDKAKKSAEKALEILGDKDPTFKMRIGMFLESLG